jgi:hypothetical protein
MTVYVIEWFVGVHHTGLSLLNIVRDEASSKVSVFHHPQVPSPQKTTSLKMDNSLQV